MVGVIHAIDEKSIRSLCTGQVVSNIAGVCKELIENSLDAGASTIEVKLKEFGVEAIEVSDNGCGIRVEDFGSLAKAHHTSKLDNFSSLSQVNTFGFRGEALSALAAISNLTVVTCAKNDTIAHKLQFDHNGALTDCTGCPRAAGTTVIVSNLFTPLPVRRKEFQRHAKQEYQKLVHLVSAYGLISTGVRILCSYTTKGVKTTSLTTTGNPLLAKNITDVFGHSMMPQLVEFQQQVPDENAAVDMGLNIQQLSTISFKISGYISSCKHGFGRSTPDRQFLFANRRVWENSAICRTMNEVYRQFNRDQYPVVILNVDMAPDTIDVNVCPDKRQIYIGEQEKLLLATLKYSTMKMFESASGSVAGVFSPVNLTLSQKRFNPKKTVESEPPEPSSKEVLACRNTNVPSDLPQVVKVAIPPPTQVVKMFTPQQPLKQLRIDSDFAFVPVQIAEKPSDMEIRQLNVSRDNDTPIKWQWERRGDTPSPFGFEVKSSVPRSANSTPDYFEPTGGKKRARSAGPKTTSTERKRRKQHRPSITPIPLYFDQTPLHNETLETNMIRTGARSRPNSSSFLRPLSSTEIAEIDAIVTSKMANVSGEISGFMATDEFDSSKKNPVVVDEIADDLELLLKQYRKSEVTKLQPTAPKFKARIAPSDNTVAQAELDKSISKDDFAKMNVVGQFNNGFIIVEHQGDLFIVDQHAADEKYNFERFSATEELQTQKLVLPKPMDLTLVNDGILWDNMAIFRHNGFDFVKDDASGKSLVTAIPVCYNWKFEKEELNRGDTDVSCLPLQLLLENNSQRLWMSAGGETKLNLNWLTASVDRSLLVDNNSFVSTVDVLVATDNCG